MMSVVVGTAGHIDHGKTALLRALTGIDADRLPEERRRGMTIDVGYAHLTLPDGQAVDFVDVPGHDRLVGNMLVGAGEVDAALLVVAADDGPNTQTIEHLELLDALGIGTGVAVLTKADLAPDDGRRRALIDEVRLLLERSALAGAPIVVASAVTGEGIDDVRAAVARMVAGVPRRPTEGGPRLAIDRAFTIRGRGTVVTGSLRNGPLAPGVTLRLLPGGADVRVREIQVHGSTVASAVAGRTALLVGGLELDQVRRGDVLTADGSVVASSRVLVALRRVGRHAVPQDRDRLRLHLGTAQADALLVRGPREAIDLPDGSSIAILRLDAPIAVAPGDRFALRVPSPGSTAGGGVVLDPAPPRGVSRRRLTEARALALATPPVGGVDARLALHGALRRDGGWRIAPDVERAVADRAAAAVAAHHAAEPESPGLPIAALRAELARWVRRTITLTRQAADEIARVAVERLLADGDLARDGDRVRDAGRAAGLPPATLEAMDRLEAALSVAGPPSLAAAARAAGCPPEGILALEAAGRIVRIEDDLAWSAAAYRRLAQQAVTMAAGGPLTPAALRDATGTSRRFVLAVLGDLDRRELLRRTDAGHVLGPRTLARLRKRAAAAAGGDTLPDGGPVGPSDGPAG
jgi:selenocysteine-specific elongation factor